MAKNNESLNNDLFGLLRSRGYQPTMLGTDGKEIPVPDEAEVYQFTFVKDGEDYGPVTLSIDGLHKLVVYFGDNVANSPSEESHSEDTSWYSLLKHLKRFSQKHQLSFEVKNTDHLKHDMAKRTHMKKVDEGYYPTGKKSSYSDNIPEVKIILQHSRALEEGERRYRAVEKIFVENASGERFAIPTNKPGLARVYARHIAEGGTPYDEQGKHIGALCEEYGQMAGFVRAVRSKQFNESTQSLVNEGINHYQSLRETLGKMQGHRGYHAYFESWTPTLTEDEDTTDLSEMFATNDLDPRIESVMPILRKLNKHISEMTEVTALDSWADDIIEESFSDVPVEEGVMDAVKRGVKNVKRGMQGWGQLNDIPDDDPRLLPGAKDSPRQLVARNKGYDDKTVRQLARPIKSSYPFGGDDTTSPHSPRGLQKRVLDREMKKRGLGAVDETAYGDAQHGEQTWQGNPTPASSIPRPWTLVLNGKVLGTDKNVAVLRALQQKRGGKIVRQGEVAEDEGRHDDELTRRPGAWRGTQMKRMTKKGQPTKAELGMQNATKQHIQMTNRNGGLTGPKGPLPEGEVAEAGRFIKGPGGVPLDRQGNPIEPKAPKVSAPRAPVAKKLTLDDVWRKVEEVVGNIYPDGDPIDWMLPWFKRQGITDYKVGEIIDRAARKNGYKDMYDYWNSFAKDIGYNESVSEGAAPWDANWKKAALASKKAQQSPSGANHRRAAELHRQGAKDPWGTYKDRHEEYAAKHEKAAKVYSESIEEATDEKLQFNDYKTWERYLLKNGAGPDHNGATNGVFKAHNNLEYVVGEWDENTKTGWVDLSSKEEDENFRSGTDNKEWCDNFQAWMQEVNGIGATKMNAGDGKYKAVDGIGHTVGMWDEKNNAGWIDQSSEQVDEDQDGNPDTDQILYYLTSGYRELLKYRDQYMSFDTIENIYNYLRDDLKQGNYEDFDKTYNRVLMKYPDAATELFDAMFEAAGLPAEEGTIEEFMAKCNEQVTEGDGLEAINPQGIPEGSYDGFKDAPMDKEYEYRIHSKGSQYGSDWAHHPKDVYHSVADAKRVAGNMKRATNTQVKVTRHPRSKLAGPQGVLPESVDPLDRLKAMLKR